MDEREANEIRAELEVMSPFLRGDAMVGMYLRHFAWMEAALEESIRRATRMQQLESVLLLRHFDFYRKTKALDALVAKCIADPEVRKRYHATSGAAARLAEERNIVAHSRFGPSEDGLRIRRIQSNSRPSLVPEVWTVDHLIAKLDAIWKIQLGFEDMTGFEDAEELWFRNLGPHLPKDQQILPPSPPAEDED